MPSQPPSARSRIRRVPQRARYDRETIEAIARAALVCHVAFSDEQGVHCIPSSSWVHAGQLHLHGAKGGRMIAALAAGEACVTLTHLDGLVFARSALHHSMNYRSVVAYGRFERVESEQEKLESLEALIEQLAPGRWREVRPPSARELAATAVMRLPLTEAAAKVRAEGVKDDPADLSRAVWAGVVPLALRPGPAVPESGCEELPVPVVGGWVVGGRW